MVKFSLSCINDQVACKDKILDALKSLGCEIRGDVGGVVKAEAKMKGASWFWSSPLMRVFGRLSINVSFANPAQPKLGTATVIS